MRSLVPILALISWLTACQKQGGGDAACEAADTPECIVSSAGSNPDVVGAPPVSGTAERVEAPGAFAIVSATPGDGTVTLTWEKSAHATKPYVITRGTADGKFD